MTSEQDTPRDMGTSETPPPITTKEWYWIHFAVKRFHDSMMASPHADPHKSVWPEVMAAVDAHARVNPDVKHMLEVEEKVRAEMAEEYSKTWMGRLFGPRRPIPPPDSR